MLNFINKDNDKEEKSVDSNKTVEEIALQKK